MNIIVIDVGGTSLRLSRTDGRRLGPVEKIPTPRKWSAARRQIVLAADRLMAGKKVQRVIIGLPGTLDKKHSTLTAAPNLKAWVGQPLARDIQYIFQAPVTLENDATLNGLGEAVFGAGKGKSVVGFLTVSTGVNGVLCINGEPDHGSFPFELRKLLIQQHGRVMSLGKAISGHALYQKYGRQPQNIHDRKIWRQTAESLAMALQNMLLTWRPDMMVIGGPMIGPRAIRLTDVQLFLKKTWDLPFSPPPIVAGRCGDNSGLWGAVALSTRK